MKKRFILVGSIFLGLIVLAAIGIGIAAVKGTALDKQSRAYIDAAVPPIVSSWNEQELLDRASPEFNQAVSRSDLGRLFRAFRSLGKLQKYEGSQGQTTTFHDLKKGTTISGAYIVNAQFDAGPAQIEIGVIKHGEQWQISGFYVKSPKFLPP